MAMAQASMQTQPAIRRLSIGVEDLAFRQLLGEPA
jgi:hypothetical protein